MNYIKTALFSLIVVLALTSCSDEEVLQGGLSFRSQTIHDAGAKTNILFQIKNEDGGWIDGAQIRHLSSGERVVTDDRGIADFQNSFLDHYGFPYRIDKSGYLPKIGVSLGNVRGIRSGDRSFITSFYNELVSMVKSNEEVLTNTGQPVNVDDIIVNVPEQLVSEDGEVYRGSVRLQLKYLNVNSPKDYVLNAPTSHLAKINDDEESRILENLALVYVELTDETGNRLRIDEKYPLSISLELEINSSAILRSFALSEADAIWYELGDVIGEGQRTFEIVTTSTGYLSIAIAHLLDVYYVLAPSECGDCMVVVCEEEGRCFSSFSESGLFAGRFILLPKDMSFESYRFIEKDELMLPIKQNPSNIDVLSISFQNQLNGFRGEVLCDYDPNTRNEWLLAKVTINDQVHYNMVNSHNGGFYFGTREKGRCKIRIEDYETRDSITEWRIETGSTYESKYELGPFLYCK